MIVNGIQQPKETKSPDIQSYLLLAIISYNHTWADWLNSFCTYMIWDKYSFFHCVFYEIHNSNETQWLQRFSSLTDTPEAPVISGMLSVTEGQLATLNCTVSYHCPSRPPALQWRWERGAQLNSSEPGEVQTLYPQAHRPMLLASMSFTVSHRVKPRLRCEVNYPGAKSMGTSKDLHVTCKHSFDMYLCAS